MGVSAKRDYKITSAQSCLRLLSLFAEALDGLSASEVAKQSGLPVSTVHRFLVSLENAGFLACNSTTSITWELGPSRSGTRRWHNSTFGG
jgi:DNA-binding IclR family transcriptional regulator